VLACVALALAYSVALGCSGPTPKPRPRRATPRVAPDPPTAARAGMTGGRTKKNPKIPLRAVARATAGVTLIPWVTNASAHRSKQGTRLTVGCVGGGVISAVWGTGVYTDDSSICTAAVHAGLITVVRGGVVTLKITAGQASYTGSTQHGVASGSWGRFSGSFQFIGSARPLPSRSRRTATGTATIPWNKTARHLRTLVARRFTFKCPPSGRLYTVWGSSIYTDDSSICSAAVHAGYIGVVRGGTVTLEMQSGQSAYQGSLRNGVRTASWRSWSRSFIFSVPTAP
jgi:hypothetical protein